MKRCSQCEFIYEDDQNVCDMDGHALVHEPTLQALEVIASRAAGRVPVQSTKSSRGRPALMAGASLLIGTVLSVGFFGFTGAYAPENTNVTSTEVSPALSAPDQTPGTPVPSSSPSSSQSAPVEETPVRPSTSPSTASAAPPLGSTARKRATTRSQSSSANHKKEKGVGGFFKKAGRVLKKPFKF